MNLYFNIVPLTDCILDDLKFVCIGCFSIALGASDSEVETVWRNTEGFIINWGNFDIGQPNGTAGDVVGVQDCLSRKPNGKWNDYNCTTDRKYYCEAGLNFSRMNNNTQLHYFFSA